MKKIFSKKTLLLVLFFGMNSGALFAMDQENYYDAVAPSVYNLLPESWKYDEKTTTRWYTCPGLAIDEQDRTRYKNGDSHITQNTNVRVWCHQVPWMFEEKFINKYAIAQNWSATERRFYIPGALYKDGKVSIIGFYEISINPESCVIFHRCCCRNNETNLVGDISGKVPAEALAAKSTNKVLWNQYSQDSNLETTPVVELEQRVPHGDGKIAYYQVETKITKDTQEVVAIDIVDKKFPHVTHELQVAYAHEPYVPLVSA